MSFDHYVTELDAAAWTGWANATPSISFQFSTSQTFSRIEIGTVRADGQGINALTSVTIAGVTFSSGVVITDGTRDWLIFDQSFSTSLVGLDPTLTISLTTSPVTHWIMLDEVRFTAISEPAEFTLLVSLLAVGGLVTIRQVNRHAVNAD